MLYGPARSRAWGPTWLVIVPAGCHCARTFLVSTAPVIFVSLHFGRGLADLKQNACLLLVSKQCRDSVNPDEHEEAIIVTVDIGSRGITDPEP